MPRRVHNSLSALDVACCFNNSEIIKLLLAKPGIDVNAKDDFGWSPVMLAAGQCNENALKLMLECPQVDLDIKTNRGKGLEECVGTVRGSEEEKKKCLDMIHKERLKRMKASDSDKESKGTLIEKKRINQREGGVNGGATKNIAGDENLIDSKDCSDSVNSIKNECGVTTEKPTVRLARIVFDATEMGKSRKTLRLNAGTPMIEIKKLFPKHLGVDEESFILCFNNREVKEETPLELFGNHLDEDDNVISIVKAIDKGDFLAGTLKSSPPERETDHELVSNSQNGQIEGYEVRKAKRTKPKCIRASCRNQGQHRCNRCKAVYYCQQECLSKDWPHHKVHCDYVYKASKDYAYEEKEDYAYNASKDSISEGIKDSVSQASKDYENSDPKDFANKDSKERGNSGSTEEVD